MAGPSRPKKRFLKIILISMALLAGLFLLALLIVPRLIPWDKVKLQAEEKISATLQHQVSMGDIGFNLFKGIEVKALRIENREGFSEQPFLSDDAVKVQYRLLPLLFGKVVIKAVVLQKPQLLIEKRDDGSFNFSDMVPAKTQAVQGEPEKKERSGIPLNVLVAHFGIENAQIVYRDLATQTEYRIENFNLGIDNLTLAGVTPVLLDLSADISVMEQVYPISMAGQFRLNYLDETLVLNGISVEVPGVKMTVAGMIETFLDDPQMKLSGKAELHAEKMFRQLPPPVLQKKIPQDLNVIGLSEVTFNLNGSTKRLDQINLTADEHIEIELSTKGLTIPLSIKGKVGFAKGNAHVDQVLEFPGFQAGLKAKLTDVMQARILVASVESTMKLDEMVPTMIPAQLSEALNGLETQGEVNVSASVKGAVNQPKALALRGHVEMKEGYVSYQEKNLVEGMAWLVTFVPTKIHMKRLDAKLGGQALSGSFVADRFDFRDPATMDPKTLKTRLVWELNSKLLDVDALLALMPAKPKKDAVEPDANQPAAEKEKKSEPDMRALVPRGLEIKGNAALGGVTFGDVTLGKVDFQFEQKKQILTMSGLIRAYRGKIQNTTRLDYSKKVLGYAIKADADKIDLEPLLNDIVATFLAAKLEKPEIIDELKDKLTGKLTGKLTLAGAGIQPHTALPALQGKGDFVIKAGRLRQFGFQDQLAKLFGSEKFRQDIPFDHTTLSFTMDRQKVHVKEFVMESGLRGQSGDIRMTAQGDIAFGAEFENFRLRPRLNPRAANNLSDQFRQYSEILKDDRGWITIPVVLNGPVKKPVVKADMQWIKNRMGSYAKRKVKAVSKDAEKKVKQFVDKHQGKSTKEIQENMSREIEKAKEKMKNLDLKNLFK